MKEKNGSITCYPKLFQILFNCERGREREKERRDHYKSLIIFFAFSLLLFTFIFVSFVSLSTSNIIIGVRVCVCVCVCVNKCVCASPLLLLCPKFQIVCRAGHVVTPRASKRKLLFSRITRRESFRFFFAFVFGARKISLKPRQFPPFDETGRKKKVSRPLFSTTPPRFSH